MTSREDETVAVQPARLIGMIMEGVAEENGADLRATERQAEMPGLAGVHGIHGEAAGFSGGARKGIKLESHSRGEEEPSGAGSVKEGHLDLA